MPARQRPRRSHQLLLSLLLLQVAVIAAYAGTSRNAKKADQIQPEARKLLEDVVQMYAGLKSLRLESETVFVMEMPGMPTKDLPDIAFVVKAAIQRPGKVRREGGMKGMGQTSTPSLAIRNGDRTWVYRAEAKEYTEARSQATKNPIPDPLRSMQAAFAPSADDVDWSFLTNGHRSATLSSGRQKIAGTDCRTINCSLPMISLFGSAEGVPPDMISMEVAASVFIADDLVVRKIEFDMTKMMKEAAKSANSKNVPRIDRMVLSTTYTKVELNPVLPDDLFVFTPPEGAKLVKEFTAPGSGSAEAASLEGKPAPEFTLPSSEGRTVSLKQLRGKPVLLNFYGEF